MDLSVKLVDLLTVAGLIVGPLAGVYISDRIQSREAAMKQRQDLFTSLMSTRTDRLAAEHLRALSLIDVAFKDNQPVRKKWAEYYESLNNSAFNNENGNAVRGTKFNDMLAEMARALKYGKHIGFEEIGRTYTPVGVDLERSARNSLRDEMLRVLKNSDSFGKLFSTKRFVSNYRPWIIIACALLLGWIGFRIGRDSAMAPRPARKTDRDELAGL